MILRPARRLDALIGALIGCALFADQQVSAAEHPADALFDPVAMQHARDALHQSHGGGTFSRVLLERAEFQSNEGEPTLVWEAQAWRGSDQHKLWLKTEGDIATEANDLEEFELQALYSRAVRPFWDLQAGIRHDIQPDPSRTYLAVGVQGVAPYWFEVDAALFLSNRGDLSARLEAEYDLRFTQRLLLQPRLELNAAFSDDPAIGVGSGMSSAEFGLRLRYEVSPGFAPYVGVSWRRVLANSADFLGDEPRRVSAAVAGLRVWF